MNLFRTIRNSYQIIIQPITHRLDRLEEAVKRQTKVQEKLANPWWNLWRGVMYGLGVFIGSALLAAILIWILSQINTAPLIGGYIDQILHFVKRR